MEFWKWNADGHRGSVTAYLYGFSFTLQSSCHSLPVLGSCSPNYLSANYFSLTHFHLHCTRSVSLWVIPLFPFCWSPSRPPPPCHFFFLSGSQKEAINIHCTLKSNYICFCQPGSCDCLSITSVKGRCLLLLATLLFKMRRTCQKIGWSPSLPMGRSF